MYSRLALNSLCSSGWPWTSIYSVCLGSPWIRCCLPVLRKASLYSVCWWTCWPLPETPSCIQILSDQLSGHTQPSQIDLSQINCHNGYLSLVWPIHHSLPRTLLPWPLWVRWHAVSSSSVPLGRDDLRKELNAVRWHVTVYGDIRLIIRSEIQKKNPSYS